MTSLAASSCLSSTHVFHQAIISYFLACLYQLLFQEELLTRLMDDGYTLNSVNIDFAEVFIFAYHRFQPTELKYFGIDSKVLNWVNWNTNRCRSFSRGALSKWCPTRFRYWPVTVLLYIIDLIAGLVDPVAALSMVHNGDWPPGKGSTSGNMVSDRPPLGTICGGTLPNQVLQTWTQASSVWPGL